MPTFSEQIDFEHFKKTGEIRLTESYLKDYLNYTKLTTEGVEYIKKLSFFEYTAKKIIELPNNLKVFLNYIINFNEEEFKYIIGDLIYHLFDFLSGDSKTLVFLLIAACTQLHNGYLMFSKLLSHEKSKKLYFILYLISITYIIVKCLLLVNSPLTIKSEEGILFLYVYASATLMLFLIFLALTTCESYLYKDKDLVSINKEIILFKLIINNTIICIPIFFYYLGLITECNSLYYFKLNFLKKESEIYSIDEFIWEIEKMSFDRNIYSIVEEEVLIEKNSLGILDKLKHTIFDSKYSYIISAILQMSALIIIIISAVI